MVKHGKTRSHTWASWRSSWACRRPRIRRCSARRCCCCSSSHRSQQSTHRPRNASAGRDISPPGITTSRRQEPAVTGPLLASWVPRSRSRGEETGEEWGRRKGWEGACCRRALGVLLLAKVTRQRGFDSGGGKMGGGGRG